MLPQLNYCLDDEDIMDDLRIINKVSGKPLQKKPQSIPPNMTAAEYLFDARIDDGRLYYDKRWCVHWNFRLKNSAIYTKDSKTRCVKHMYLTSI